MATGESCNGGPGTRSCVTVYHRHAVSCVNDLLGCRVIWKTLCSFGDIIDALASVRESLPSSPGAETKWYWRSSNCSSTKMSLGNASRREGWVGYIAESFRLA
jgi:hypothetical protein